MYHFIGRRKRSTSGNEEGKMKMINGYYENWRMPINPGKGETRDPSYYHYDISSLTHVFYSFLCLDQRPNPDLPAKKHWNGKTLYESMTAANVITVMTETVPKWENQYEWQRSKIAALIDAVHANSAKFIWAIGGWSDLTKTLKRDQIPDFVEIVVDLLKLKKGRLGDGIDFDWEHLNEDPETKEEQRMILAETMFALRKALNEEGMEDKQIGYTTRFNAFWDDEHGNKPDGYTYFSSDGEGITIEKTLNKMNSSLNEIVDWVNIMQYDVPPSDLNSPDRMDLDTYQTVLDAFSKYVDKDKLVMGFEPGHQAAGGLWEGCEMDTQVIDYVQEKSYGGVMFWAVNEHANSRENGVTGQNAQQLAKYAKNAFNTTPRKQ